MPRSIIFYRDVIFLSVVWQEFFRLNRTQLRMDTTYHPQTNDQMEVINCCLETYLHCFAHEQPKTWHKFLDLTES